MTGPPRRHRLYGVIFDSTESFLHPIPTVPEDQGLAPEFRYEAGSTPPGAEGLVTSEPVFRTVSTIEGGAPFLSFHRDEAFDVFRFSEVVDFYLRKDLIRSVIHDFGYRSAVELYFLGFVLAVWMERRCRPVLHAASVAGDGGAVAFLAGNKSGKSSLAAGFLARGWSLVADDLIPLDEHSDGFWVHPGYPELRLWPDAVDALFEEHCGLSRVHPQEDKRRVPVELAGSGGRAPFASEGTRLKVIIIPRRGPETNPINLRPVDSKQEALRELIKGSFLGSFPRILGVEGSRLEILGRAVRNVPVFRMDYPAGWENLDLVVDAVAELRDRL